MTCEERGQQSFTMLVHFDFGSVLDRLTNGIDWIVGGSEENGDVAGGEKGHDASRGLEDDTHLRSPENSTLHSQPFTRVTSFSGIQGNTEEAMRKPWEWGKADAPIFARSMSAPDIPVRLDSGAVIKDVRTFACGRGKKAHAISVDVCRGDSRSLYQMLYAAQEESERHKEAFELATRALIKMKLSNSKCAAELRRMEDVMDDALWKWCRSDRRASELSKKQWLEHVEKKYLDSGEEEDDEDGIEKFLREQGHSSLSVSRQALAEPPVL